MRRLLGFCSIEGPNFPRTRVVSESYLNKQKKTPLGMLDENVIQVSLLGTVQKPKRKIDLLYSITSKRPTAKISNLVQVAGTILGQSRNIFLGKILTILRFFDPALVEIAYHGELKKIQILSTNFT